MKRDQFLSGIASRLSRPLITEAPLREFMGVTERYRRDPFNGELPRKEWSRRFAEELSALGGTVLVCDTLVDVSTTLRHCLGLGSSGAVVTWARSEFKDWDLDFLWDDYSAIQCIKQPSSDGMDEITNDMMSSEFGITTVDFAVVNTGTLALYTDERRNRSVSLLPAHHIALIRESQMVARLGEAFPSSGAKSVPSSIHFISGPSRSADIENDLSIGVHGPGALTAIICNGI